MNIGLKKIKFNQLFTLWLMLGSVLFSAPFSALAQEAKITVSKGNAFRCAITPTVAPKYEGRNALHYAKDEHGKRHLSRDLGRRSKGLAFFKLKPSQVESMTAQLMMPYGEYFTFWYMIDHQGKLLGPKSYDFVVAPLSHTERENHESRFIDIALEQDLPCSCFSYDDKPKRCMRGGMVVNNIKTKAKSVGKKVGEKVGEYSHQAFESVKRGAGNVKRGWDNYKEQPK